MSDSVQPHRQQPTRLPRPWDSPGKNTGVGCRFLLQCVKVKSLSRAQLLVTPWTAGYQAPPSMGFSRQEYWSGVPLLQTLGPCFSKSSPPHFLTHPAGVAIACVLLLILFFTAVATAAKSLQSCPTLCDPMDCRLPGSSVHEIF